VQGTEERVGELLLGLGQLADQRGGVVGLIVGVGEQRDRGQVEGPGDLDSTALTAASARR